MQWCSVPQNSRIPHPGKWPSMDRAGLWAIVRGNRLPRQPDWRHIASGSASSWNSSRGPSTGLRWWGPLPKCTTSDSRHHWRICRGRSWMSHRLNPRSSRCCRPCPPCLPSLAHRRCPRKYPPRQYLRRQVPHRQVHAIPRAGGSRPEPGRRARLDVAFLLLSRTTRGNACRLRRIGPRRFLPCKL
jgi:hypothetical protein